MAPHCVTTLHVTREGNWHTHCQLHGWDSGGWHSPEAAKRSAGAHKRSKRRQPRRKSA